MATCQSTVPEEEDSDDERDKGQKSTDLSSSITSCSDEAKEMHCEECKEHSSINRPAVGFCVDCEEYKCSLCLEYHRRYYKTHNLQDKASMPKDFCFEKCLTHPALLIKFYCEQCETFACSECKSHSHHNCDKVKHLPTLVQGIEHRTELNELKEKLEKFSKDEENMKMQIQDQCEISDLMEAKSKSTITKHKEKLISTYREQQKEIIGKFDMEIEQTVARLKNERKQLAKKLAQKQQNFEKRICKAELSILNYVKSSNTKFAPLKEENTSLSITLKGLAASLVHAQALGENCKLFIAMKDAENSLLRLRQNILELKNYQLKCYTVEPLEQNTPFETLDNITSFFSYKELPMSAMERVATFYKEIQLKSPCTCTYSICLLPGNKLLAADYNITLIHVVKDIHTNSESYDSIEMPYRPWAIALVQDNKVAVTFPDKGIVRLITFSDSMTVISTDDITVGAWCRGIFYRNNTLIVSYTTRLGKVQILDMSGNVLKCFDRDGNGLLFRWPCYLTFSPDNTTIYVSDRDENNVTSLTLDGDVKAIYRDDQLRRPHQLTVDESGTVYVCGWWSHNVHQLSSDLDKVKILLDESQGMGRAESVAYCQNNSRLYVGMGTGTVKVFNISTKYEL